LLDVPTLASRLDLRTDAVRRPPSCARRGDAAETAFTAATFNDCTDNYLRGNTATVEKNLKRLRKAAGLTQEQLVRKAKLSHGYYQRLEMGRHDPPMSTLRALAKALGVKVTELLE